MTDDILSTMPHRTGHFLLESGFHADLWFNLDTLFTKPREIAPLISELARRLTTYNPDVVCGPLLGGAFLAQAIAIELGIDFYHSEPGPSRTSPGLFSAAYRLPPGLKLRASGKRVALVDDVISAGSSVRATAATLDEAGASVVVVGAFVLLGNRAADHFQSRETPVEALAQREFRVWDPAECPMCHENMPVQNGNAIE